MERLRSRVVEAGAPGESGSQLAYLEKREAQMDYPHFLAEQWPIGSGSVESANKLVVEERLKGAGMHWAEQNVNPMLALRNAICSDRWEEVWMQIEQEQRRAEHVRRMQRQRQRRVAQHDDGAHVAKPAASCLQWLATDQGTPTQSVTPVERPTGQASRPADDHPWRKAWSKRRQREIASTA